MTDDLLIQIAGWIPAIVFPFACLIQLLKILREKTSQGVSILAWLAFGFANVSLYVYTEKYFSLQTIFGMLGSALIDFIIVIAALYYSKIRIDDQKVNNG